jgi:hypothetical protein
MKALITSHARVKSVDGPSFDQFKITSVDGQGIRVQRACPLSRVTHSVFKRAGNLNIRVMLIS